MKLKYKLFITLVSSSCLILLLVMVVMQFSIRRNFIDFLNDVEFSKQTKMIGLLKASFNRNSGWDELEGHPGAWHRLVRMARPDKISPDMVSHGFDRKRPGPPPRPFPNDPGSLHNRLCLFDAQKNYVAGDCRRQNRFDFNPIKISGRTIGYLGLEDLDDMRQPLELAFLKKQTQSYYIIGTGVLLLALVISFMVSRHLLSPVRELVKGTRAMGKFNFDTRINVRSTDELGGLAADFNRMARTLKQYEAMRKNWISDISHELRTPVAVIRSKIEALQDGIRQSSPEMLDSLHKDILMMGKLIDDLHRISLIDSRNLVANLKPVSVLPLAEQVLETFLIRFENQHIEVQKEWGAQRDFTISADAELLKRVFSNLFENTLKYTDSPGVLKLGCRAKKDNLIIDIEDSSPGVPRDCLESIFERLYRVERSRNRSLGGSGLGLSMSREIISMHNGTISAFGSSMGGLKVEIRLPFNKITTT